LVFALIDGTLFQGFLALGLFRTGAGLGSLLIDSQPLAVAVLVTLIYKEVLDRRIVLALAVGLVGIAAIGLPPRLLAPLLAGDWLAVVQGGLFDTGEWLMLGAALSMAVGTVIIRPVTRYADPVMATGWHLLLGGLPLLAASGFLEETPWTHLTAWDTLGLAYASLAGSAIAYGLFFYFAAGGNLTALSTLTFSTPLFALLFGGLFLGERLRPLQWGGVALTLVAIYLASTRRPPSPTPEV
jgi:drug/metabolite transporter (DMT)-like permease